VAVALGVRLGVGSSLILGRLLRSDPEPWVRTVAARELGLVGGKAALKVLLRTAPTAGQDELPTLVRALGRVGRGSAEAYGCLETALTSSSEQVREAALLAMGQSLHPCRHDAAVSHLADGSPAVRRAAVTLLDGAPAGSEALRRACLDPEPTVASLARAAAG
jgi:HEAT repeat protein